MVFAVDADAVGLFEDLEFVIVGLEVGDGGVVGLQPGGVVEVRGVPGTAVEEMVGDEEGHVVGGEGGCEDDGVVTNNHGSALLFTTPPYSLVIPPPTYKKWSKREARPSKTQRMIRRVSMARRLRRLGVPMSR